jgi:YbgC/YbaW family acyl-CoA thioester hydrolase
MDNTKGRLITRKMYIQPQTCDLDMVGVVYNVHYFKWFDEARFRVMLETISVDEIIETGLVFMIAENHCEYKNFITYGEPLVLYTSHRVCSTYQGRFDFTHCLMHEKKKIEIASGSSSVIMINHKTKKLLHEIPDFIWNRYINLK